MKIKNYNNLIAILLVVFNVLFIFNILLINYKLTKIGYGARGEEISGLVTSGTVSLCINDADAPSINILHPLGGAIVNETANASANLLNPQGNTDFTLTFSYFNSSTASNIGEDTYDGDYNFNASWNTTSVADGNCNYKIKIQGESSETACWNFDTVNSDFFTIDNVYVEPTWYNFRNSITTNFSLYNRWSNLSDIIIGNTYGSINFSGAGWNFDSVNIDNEAGIGNNSINLTLTSNCFSVFSVNLSLFSFDLANPIVLRNGEACPSMICSNINLSDSILRFTVNRFGNYTATGNSSSNLEIWDDTDSKRGNLIKLANQNVMFFVNYTSNETKEAINGNNIFCEIRFNISQAFTSPVNTGFNGTSGLYEYVRNFSSRGNYSWNAFCDGSAKGFITQNITDKVFITNTPPKLTQNISNLEWNEDTILTGLDLNDYFSDADGDALNYTHTPVSNILIVIDSDGVVSFIPDANWYGLRKIVFTANDSINATDSNNATLIVNDVAEAATSEPSAAAASGGGGGGGGYRCIEEWYCIPWGPCISGMMTRKCYDLNNCFTTNNKPNETAACGYIASCYDGIKNNGEEGIDCGGPCPSCFTCYDRQKNQDETDIDCGGKICRTCLDGKKCLENSDCESDYCNPDKICSIPTCFDGWQNQDEEGIDCGGSCPKCPVVEQPTIISRILTPYVLFWLILLLLLLLLMNLFGHRLLVIFYRLSRSKQRIPKERLEYATGYALKSLNQLERDLSNKTADYIFEKLVRVFVTFLKYLLRLEQGFTAEQLKERLIVTRMDNRIKRLLLIYHNNLLRYRGLTLTKRDIQRFIIQCRKLILFILKNVETGR